MKNPFPFLDDLAADDLFIEADMRDDVLADMVAPATGLAAAVTAGAEPYPSKPNPNFPDIDFDEHEDAGAEYDFAAFRADIMKQLSELRVRF